MTSWKVIMNRRNFLEVLNESLVFRLLRDWGSYKTRSEGALPMLPHEGRNEVDAPISPEDECNGLVQTFHKLNCRFYVVSRSLREIMLNNK